MNYLRQHPLVRWALQVYPVLGVFGGFVTLLAGWVVAVIYVVVMAVIATMIRWSIERRDRKMLGKKNDGIPRGGKGIGSSQALTDLCAASLQYDREVPTPLCLYVLYANFGQGMKIVGATDDHQEAVRIADIYRDDHVRVVAMQRPVYEPLEYVPTETVPGYFKRTMEPTDVA